MGIYFDVSLAWGCPVAGNYFDLEEKLITNPNFELMLTGSQMGTYPDMNPFIHIKKYGRNLCDKDVLPDFNYLSIKDLVEPTEEEIKNFLQWRYDNGLKMISKGLSYHIVGSFG